MNRRRWVTLVVLVGLWAPGGAARAEETDEAPPDAGVETAPVSLDGNQLFRVRGVTSFPAQRRASEISERLASAAADPAVTPESVELVEGQLGTEVRVGDQRIVVLTDADAEVEGIQRLQLAGVVQNRVQEAIRLYREERTRDSLLVAAKKVALAVGLFALAVLIIELVWRRLYRRLDAALERRVKDLAIGSFQVVRAERIAGTLRSVSRTVHWLLLLGLGFWVLVYGLKQFPWTRAFGGELGASLIKPLTTIATGIVANVPDFIFLAVMVLVTRWLLKLIKLFFDGVGRGEVELDGFDREWAEPTYKLARVAIIAFAVVVAYPYIPGSDSPAFKGVSLFLGLVFSLSSSSAISNIVAGYVMTYRRAFKEGDRVKIGDVSGAVDNIRLQTTNLRTPKNEIVVIPNSTILNSEVVNYSALAASEGLILYTTVGIGYETPWRQVEAMLLLAAERTPGLAKGREPFVHQKSLGDFAITYEINVYAESAVNRPQLYSALHRQILDVFNEYGVQIMTPAYEGDPEIPKVVKQADWFTGPAKPESSKA